MNDYLEAQYEKVALGINTMADAIKEGNYLSNKLQDVAEQQVAMTRRQVESAERQAIVAERPRLYSELDVWDMLTELGLVGPYRMQCYQFLCENDQKKRQVFGIPPEMRLDALFQFMTAAGVRIRDIIL
ncbi:hypothetical protein PIB30_029125 [Stylosanthes scabra]|uniref:Uncharacterized protein n=1 Tax=Stylosanthes scabra TaxID=79078 RepID=A0ABU6V9I5_9FABA|nr:hypothetical protein [Stylosanthes scabra]